MGSVTARALGGLRSASQVDAVGVGMQAAARWADYICLGESSLRSEALGGKRALLECVRTAALRKKDSSPTRSMPLAIASHSGHLNTGTLRRSSPWRLKKLLP